MPPDSMKKPLCVSLIPSQDHALSLNLKKLFIFTIDMYINVCQHVCICELHTCLMPAEVRRGC